MDVLFIGFLMGLIFGIILHEKLFPENKTVNEITNKFKKSEVITDTKNVSPELTQKLERRRHLFGRLFGKKNRP
jgi:hypothetical protein